jgi:hypothetical protein
MRRILTFGWGGLLVLIGVGLLSWVGYNLLVEMQPAAEGRSPIKPALFAVVMIGVGVARIRSQLREPKEKGPDDVA